MDRPFWRLPACWLGLCGHRTESDDTGIWGQCVRCGNRAGFVSRAELRRYADRVLKRPTQESSQADSCPPRENPCQQSGNTDESGTGVGSNSLPPVSPTTPGLEERARRWLKQYDWDGENSVPDLAAEFQSLLDDHAGGGGWRPIASAPKDGTWIVAMREGEHDSFEVGSYDPWMSERFVEVDGGLYRKEPYPAHEWKGFSNMHRMTHWAPLPAPPQSGEG